ncbi:MFS transporter [Streptomyces albus subsp. chlorinus]|uniref:MFS transporter n=1 Tax=Streptomyces albus TaxID=1888 RepID=UPI00157139AC|nr:MFS transporter [Streptomyces albus]NSC24418.1 MFS transporter [Streptomyces albus subsp. chlorinus]
MRAYLTTAFLARLADEGVGVALALLALARTGSPAPGAFVLTAWLAPHALAAPLVGDLAERARHRRLFHGCALTAFAAAIAVLGLTVGRAATPLVLAAALLGGSAGPVVTGSLSSLVAGLVPEGPARTRAYALDATTYNAAAVLAPAAVTATAAATSPGLATALLAASAAGAALTATLLLPAPAPTSAPAPMSAPAPTPTPARGPATTPAATGAPAPTPASAPVSGPPLPFRHRLAAGVRALGRVPQLRAVTLATCVAFLGLGGLPVVAVLLAVEQGNAEGGGVLLAAFAVGGLAGSLGAARWRGAPEPGRLALGGLLTTGCALAAAAVMPAFGAAVVLFAVAGLGDGPLLTATLRIRADHAPESVRTQVFTLGAGLKLTAAAAGAALVGTLSALPPRALVLAVAALQLAAAVLLRTLARTPDR